MGAKVVIRIIGSRRSLDGPDRQEGGRVSVSGRKLYGSSKVAPVLAILSAGDILQLETAHKRSIRRKQMACMITPAYMELVLGLAAAEST
ncbi:MAG: hypothetical protein C5B49_07125 [Bdellovibrio sp.]|nr:MAG: hypothetical protein C5B49_07125 [Bdellovibrio sp.]